MRITGKQLRQIIKEEVSRSMNEMGGSGSRFLVDEFYRGHDDDVDRIRNDFGLSKDPVGALEDAIRKMSEYYGYRSSENEITDAAIKIARDIGAEMKAISKTHYERDIEDPYGPEISYRDDY